MNTTTEHSPVVNSSSRSALGSVTEFLRFVRDPLDGFRAQQRRWGDVVRLPFPGPANVQFTHPLHVGEVLRMPVKDSVTRSMRDIMGRSLLTDMGPRWKRRRRMVTPAFSPKMLQHFQATIDRLVDGFAKDIAPVSGSTSRTVNVSAATLKVTLDVILETVFGGHITVDRALVAKQLEQYMYEFYLDNGGWRKMVPPRVPTLGRWKRRAAIHQVNPFVYDSIAKRRSQPEGPDLLYSLLNARDADGTALSDEDLRDELVTLVLAGHETTALMVTFSLWLLSRAPETQNAVRSELRAHGTHASTGRDTLRACGLLQGTMNEALRLFPPAYVVAREAHEAMSVGGVPISKGSQLLAPACVVHRDPRWWKDPHDFRPERWTNGETDELPQNAYFPFGGGPRLCVGQHFSKFEASIILARLLGEFEFSVSSGYTLELMPSVTLRPRDGVKLDVRRVAPVESVGVATREASADGRTAA